MDPQVCNESQLAKFASSKQQQSAPLQGQISADSLCSPEPSRKQVIRIICADSTSVELMGDGENQGSIRSLPTPPVNDVSIEIPQTHHQLTLSKRWIAVKSAGEGPVDEERFADKHKPYENNFTPVNPPENSASRNTAARLERCSDKAAITVHAPRSPRLLKFSTETHSLRGFPKASRKSRVSEKFRIGKKNPHYSLSPASDILISKRFGRVDTRKNSQESLLISEQSSHQMASLTHSDSSCPVSHAYPKSLASNYNGLEDVIPYLCPPVPMDINKISYKAPKDRSFIPAVSLPQQASASEPRARKRVTCGNCGEAGHNLRSCPENYCSYCAEDGHKVRDCPLAKEEAEAIKQKRAETAGRRP